MAEGFLGGDGKDKKKKKRRRRKRSVEYENGAE